MAGIQLVQAREILDSRGVPTIETLVTLDNGVTAIASVPSGTSTGKHEAVEVRDKDPQRFSGKGVLKGVQNVNQVIAPAIVGMDPTRQTALDQAMVNLDGTVNKEHLGANAILSVSIAAAKAGALSVGLPLYEYFRQKYQLISTFSMPTPIFNLINGGAHGAGNLDFQEFQVVPASNKTYSQALQMGAEIFMTLEEVLISKGAVHAVGIEGGFSPNLYTNVDAFQLFFETVAKTKYVIAQDLFLSLDAAANYFYKGGKYKIRDRVNAFSTTEMIQYYKELHEQYHVFAIEDGLMEDDWEGWKKLTQGLQQYMLIIGDDFLSTNKERVQRAIQEGAATAVLVKPNQIGTISETVEVVKMARDAGWQCVFSHRSGETTDDFMADFAVGLGADYVKFGAPNRGERVSKYNRLLKIESELQLA